MAEKASDTGISDLFEKVQRGVETLSTIRDEDVDIATAPKDLVARIGNVVLYRYRATAPRSGAHPMLVVYSQVGRYTMMDLQPDRSVVRNLLDHGIDVFMIDWGHPSRAERWRTFDDYVCEYIGDFADVVLAETGFSKLSVLGICEGGVFATCYAALEPHKVERLALAVTPIDFHADEGDTDSLDQGYINRWIRNFSRSELEHLIDSFGQMPGHVTGMMFQEMTPVKSMTKYSWDLKDTVTGSRDQVINFLRMEKWLSDRPHHPSEAAKQWLIDLYKENRLVKGEFELDGERIDLGQLTMPILNVFARKDHIVPPPTSKALRDHVSADRYDELELGVGHIGTFVSRKANRVFSDRLAEWLHESMADVRGVAA